MSEVESSPPAWRAFADQVCAHCPHPAFIHRTRKQDGACLGDWSKTRRGYGGCACPGFESENGG